MRIEQLNGIINLDTVGDDHTIAQDKVEILKVAGGDIPQYSVVKLDAAASANGDVVVVCTAGSEAMTVGVYQGERSGDTHTAGAAASGDLIWVQAYGVGTALVDGTVGSGTAISTPLEPIAGGKLAAIASIDAALTAGASNLFGTMVDGVTADTSTKVFIRCL
jgi:hypothetical protein